jgi:hypothetical protein
MTIRLAVFGARHIEDWKRAPMALLFVIAVLLLFAAWDLLHR